MQNSRFSNYFASYFQHFKPRKMIDDDCPHHINFM